MAAQPLLNRINHRKGVLLAGALAVIAWSTYPFFVQSSVPIPAPPVVVKTAPVSVSQVAMPQGFQQLPVTRDPFQMPKEALPPNPVVGGADSRVTSSASAPQPYQLTGIAIGNGTAAAILESSTGSRSYRVGEYAGAYQVREITAESVLLVGPTSSHVLKMRR